MHLVCVMAANQITTLGLLRQFKKFNLKIESCGQNKDEAFSHEPL